MKHTQGEWRLEPVTKEQAGHAQYMALVAPNGKVFGMFYDPVVAAGLVKRLNSWLVLREVLKAAVHHMERTNDGEIYIEYFKSMLAGSEEEAGE